VPILTAATAASESALDQIADCKGGLYNHVMKNRVAKNLPNSLPNELKELKSSYRRFTTAAGNISTYGLVTD
jgi:hypothetical protein